MSMARKILALALALFAACGSPRDTQSRVAEARPPLPQGRGDRGEGGEEPRIVFFGTSLTAGLGVDPDEAYPALIQQKLDSLGLAVSVVNAGVSGETSAAGLRRIDWILREPVAVLVLELGANDALRGLELKAAKENVQDIINRTRAKYPDVKIVVAGMRAPPNLGRRYTEEFRRMFVDLARENRATLIPFLLESVGGVPELNQPDGIHPNVEGHKIVATNVWKVLEPVVQSAIRNPKSALWAVR
jgi:acyl-CoA thioesterase-1